MGIFSTPTKSILTGLTVTLVVDSITVQIFRVTVSYSQFYLAAWDSANIVAVGDNLESLIVL